jgi:hypothetical protein
MMRKPLFKMAATTATLVPCQSNFLLVMALFWANRAPCKNAIKNVFKTVDNL